MTALSSAALLPTPVLADLIRQDRVEQKLSFDYFVINHPNPDFVSTWG